MKTNRWKFITGLFGFGVLAKAQQPIAADAKAYNTPAWSHYRPKNNQCPVCGTMARPHEWDSDFERAIAERAPSDSMLPQINIARCLRCNAAFWQDTEKP